jgi:FkbM family methyltransferase
MPIYFDCGSNLGQGYKIMRDLFKMDDSWTIVFIEPNSNCLEELSSVSPHGSTIINCALDTEKGEKTLNIAYCQEQKEWIGGESNTLSKDSGWEEYFAGYTEETNHFGLTKKVSSVVLGELVDGFNPNNEDVYLKLDIEGKEYDVLEQFVESEQFKNVRYIAVEWHCRFFGNSQDFYDRKAAIEKKLSEAPNLTYDSWH